MLRRNGRRSRSYQRSLSFPVPRFTQTQGVESDNYFARQSLSALLRGELEDWRGMDRFDSCEFLRACDYHGVGPLLWHQLKRNVCPDSIAEAFESAALQAAVEELIRRRAIEIVITALAAGGVALLLMKGTALAYTLYPAPELRSRSDTDVLIRKSDLARALEVFTELGYTQPNAAGGDLVSAELGFSKYDEFGVTHHFDLHWRISNFHVLGEMFQFAELLAASAPVVALGAQARGLGAVHALLLACMHRLSHRQAPYYVDGVAHFDSDRLIWLYDIHLLCRELADAQWARVSELARCKGLEEICLDGLLAAADCLATPIPAAALASLRAAHSRHSIAVARFSAPRWRWELSQLAALSDWRQRIRLVRQHLFPAPDYVLEKYHTGRRALLPLLYLHRSIAGLWKRL
jgi:hypothetical protein